MAKEKNSKKLKIIITVLLVLLLLSVGALTARVVYLNFFADKSTTTIVPDNLIGKDPKTLETAPDNSDNDNPTKATPSASTTNNNSENVENKATVIELYKWQPSDNEKFLVTNMLPGDTETKYFAVKVSHHTDVAVYFNAEITEQSKNLANVLHIKVTHLENGKEIYNGTFADMNIDGYGETFATTESTETVAYYKIEVSLPTSTGNEYQAASLLADFNWYVKDTDALDSPGTGDTSNIVLWFVLMLSSLVMIIIQLFSKRKEKEDENAEAN